MGGTMMTPKKYPVRARLCVKGNRIWHEWVKELDIPHVWNGALVVAMSDDVRDIKNLLRRGKERCTRDEDNTRGGAFSMEPSINRNAVAALWIPTVGQIDPVRAVMALIENAVMNGVKVHLETERPRGSW